MDKLRLTLLISMGIFASGSGIIQVSATDYSYFVDFSTKTVANFNDFTPTFLETTADLDNTIQFTANTFYRMNTCPPSIAADPRLEINYRLNATGSTFSTFVNLPDMPCTTVNTFYQITGSVSIPSEHLAYIVSDDANFLNFQPVMFFASQPSTAGRVITLTDFGFVLTINYDFNTTYLFNYFLSDTQFVNTVQTAGIAYSGTRLIDFDYVMTTAGNDRYFIINSDSTNYGTTRTRWAIDNDNQYFRGESIGSRYRLIQPTITISNTTSGQFFLFNFNYYFLNASNKEQDISNVPEFEFEYEDCGWDAFDIPCFINNGLAYVVNDAPVISDAFTLLNAGMKMGGQAFAIIGQFSDNNLFGVLVLGGLGITAVRWFLKQD
jgi:hypothetical protein